MGRRQTVLIVEDDQNLRHLLRTALFLAGYDVQEARSGFEALRLLDSAPPDLVILDLALPGIDGYTIRHELAAHVHTSHIPIVIVTGSTDNLESLKVNCLLRKPNGRKIKRQDRRRRNRPGRCGLPGSNGPWPIRRHRHERQVSREVPLTIVTVAPG